MVLAKQKRAEEVKPWANIKRVAPAKLQGVWIRMAAVTRPMWLTDE